MKVQIIDREDLDSLHNLMTSERLALRYVLLLGDVSRAPGAT